MDYIRRTTINTGASYEDDPGEATESLARSLDYGFIEYMATWFMDDKTIIIIYLENDSGIELSANYYSSISPSEHGLSGLKGFNSR